MTAMAPLAIKQAKPYQKKKKKSCMNSAETCFVAIYLLRWQQVGLRAGGPIPDIKPNWQMTCSSPDLKCDWFMSIRYQTRPMIIAGWIVFDIDEIFI